MSAAKKIGITLLVLLLVLGIAAFVLTRGSTAAIPIDEVVGTDPRLAEPDAETVPTVKIAEPVGWAAGQAPKAAQGIAVSRFAEGLDHPRTLYTLPNGDVLVSLTRAPAQKAEGGIKGWIAGLLMGKAGATGPSPDKVILLRDSDGDGKADVRQVIVQGIPSPSGLAWQDGTLYVAAHNAVWAYPYALGTNAVGGAGRKLTDLAGGGGHWMRNLLLSADGKNLFVAVGSATNIGDEGMAAEEGRALIWELDLASGSIRQYAGGLRNPNGLDLNPWSGELWTTVNERDMLGSDLVPDYLTNVPLGAQYGWPWVYWGNTYDRRVKYDIPDYINYVRKPEYALGPHVAALGLAFTREGARLGDRFNHGAVIARHGSWNRKPPSGYDVVYVAFDARGNPTGRPVPLLTGFLTGKGTTHGRPTWVTFARDGSLLVSDDTAGIIWRAIAPNARPAGPITRVETGSLPARTELRGQEATFGPEDYARQVPAN